MPVRAILLSAGSCARFKMKVLDLGLAHSGTILALKTSSLVRETYLGSLSCLEIQPFHIQGEMIIKKKE